MKTQDQLLDQLLGQVDSHRLMKSVEEITKQIRLSATPEEARAFHYLENTLTKFGLDVRLFHRPAYISLPRSAELIINGETINCATHSMLPSVSALTADLCYIASSQLNDKCQHDLNGKILLTEGLAMASVLQDAARQGAVGVIFITGKRIHEMIVSNVWGSPTPYTDHLLPTLPAVSINAVDGAKLKEMALTGTLSAVMSTKVEHLWVDLPILTADLTCDSSPYYLLFTGHVDSWHYGAMDNASGNAAALEIARLLSPQKDRLRRGVKFVFWSGHSHGRYAGSTAFCDANFEDLHDNCFLHINADCLGGKGASVLTQAACMAETKNIGETAVRKVTGETLEGVRFGRSCDQSFWGTGTPSLFSGVSEQPLPEQNDAASTAFNTMFGGGKSGGFGWWWHTTADTIELLDPENLKRDCQIYLCAVYIACIEQCIPFQESAAVAELTEFLQHYAALTSAELDFSDTLSSILQLQRSIELIERHKNNDPTPIWTDTYNQLIIKLEQLLIPLNYVKGSIYHHDPAIRQPPIPLLEEITDLVAAKGDHTRQTLCILLQRRLNQVRHQIKRANELANAFLQRGKI